MTHTTNPSTAPETFDVAVVGGGGAGLAAAYSAAENGASVIVLEKQPELGGSTGIAVGSLTANGTVYQRRAGISDSLEAHAEDAGKFAPETVEARNNEALRRFFLSHTNATLEWLRKMGLAFHGPSPEPPNRVPRMHNVVPGARAYIHVLHKRLAAKGGRVLCNAAVTELMMEGGRVAGVWASVAGERRAFAARKGVVLAAGDYANAPDLIGEFKGEEYVNIEGIYEHAQGDGHRLAQQAGAPLVNMDVTYGPELRFIPPEKKNLIERLPAGGVAAAAMGKLMPFAPRFIVNAAIKRQLVTWQHPEDALFDDGAILVNAKGARFCNEKESPGREIAIAAQPGKHCYILIDKRIIEKYSQWPHFISTAPEIAYAYVEDYLRLRPDVAVGGDTLEHVAAARNLPLGRLQATIDAFNRYAMHALKDEFGRTGDETPLKPGRWVLLGPAKAYFTTTEGAPMVNERMQVLDADGQPIPGLYAAGQNGLGGQILWGHGLHIAWAITSGRMAGAHLAAGK